MVPALGVPLTAGWRDRLAAWWHGHEPLAREVRKRHPAQRPAGKERPVGGADRERIRAIEAPQYVWGEGLVGPGTKGFYERLLAPLNLQEDARLLLLGAGLGEPARQISERFGVQVLGLEASAAVVAKGSELSEAAGVADRVSLRGFNPELVKLNKRAQDCVLVEPLLFTLQNKLELLRELDVTLKPDGKVVLLDYVVGAMSDEMRRLWDEWQEVERPRPRPRTVDELKGLFKKARLRIHTTHDITSRYNAMITRAWARCLDRIETMPRAEQQANPVIQAVADLAELWARRSLLMERGALRVVQVTATKAKFGR